MELETKVNIPIVNIDSSQVVDIAKKAGDAIMEVYKRDFEVYEKSDKSPLTEADLASHKVIVESLKGLTPDLPVLSEESSKEEVEGRMSWQTYWLIDPLDGTKEFIKKNGEFTVNIALVHQNKVVFGVVDAPVLDVTYWGGKDVGSRKLENSIERSINVADKNKNTKDMKVVGSRSHQSQEFIDFIADYPGAEIISMGSSLKLCLVAEGSADLYPRLGLTSEWDTAAAHAVVEGAGGSIVSLEDNMPLSYNTKQDTLLNPYFLAST